MKQEKSIEMLNLLSNEYYSTIPHVKIHLIKSIKDINIEKKLLNYMLNNN